MSKVDSILKLLGADEAKGRTPVLIPIQAKSKGPVAPGWNETTWERMGDEDYRAILEAHPNTGVILGGASGALATIDIDVDEFVRPFLEANPRLARSLRTKGSKGCQIWVWLKPDEKLSSLGLPEWIRGFPDRRMNITHRTLTTETADKDGATKRRPLVWGEWRSGGVQSVIQTIIDKGKIPIVIGGGHNNALPLIKGCAEALNQSINCLNIDAHTDLRQDAYRHSGNGFYRAMRHGVLDRYGIFGLQKNTLSKALADFMHQKNAKITSLTLDQWWSTATQHMDARLESWCADLIQKDFGLELDMDVLADMGSSAQSPVGLGLMEVMSLIKKLKGNQNLRYVHLCEGAPELGLYPAQVVKALGAIVLAVVD
ncbi:MAG: hypothetical protein EBY38_06470 [Flavobacteriaceae bacterium]|nr:hypothetical protein [Flavobacteriaceae bacterium]